MDASPRVIVIGNEKGGTGKSTTAMHLAVGLAKLGARVGTMDLDCRQATLSRYLENRCATATAQGRSLAAPIHRQVPQSDLANRAAAGADEQRRFEISLDQLSRTCNVVIIDTPGSDSHLSRIAHGRADILVTPVNDSLVDLDVLGRIDAESHKVIAPSHYSELVWEERKRRAKRDGGRIDWVVLRNRLSPLDARNKRTVHDAIAQMSARFGFRVVPGFSERVVFREMFLKGLTLLDLGASEGGVNGAAMTMSHLAGRAELRGLLDALGASGEAPNL